MFELDDTSISIIAGSTEINENMDRPQDANSLESVDASKTLNTAEDTSGHSEDEKPAQVWHAFFESPDDVGADLSSSPSIRSHNGGTDELVSPIEPSFNPREIKTPKISVSAVHTLPSQLQQVHRQVHAIHPKNHSHPLHSTHPTSNSHGPTSAPHGPEAYRYKYAVGEDRRWHEGAQSKASTDLKELIEEVRLRRQRTESRERHPGRFKPSMLPSLKVLTLTDLPSTTRRRQLIESITLFMQECPEEEEIARLEELERQRDQDPRIHQLSECGIFRLQRLVLEITSAADPIAPPRSPGPKRNSFTKSSTEDADSESFMEASKTDFSFFGEDDGGLLASEGRIDAPRRVDDGMILNCCLSSTTDIGRSLDVISELSKFRREQKAKHETMVRFGGSKLESALLGYWVGEVKVVKNVVDI